MPFRPSPPPDPLRMLGQLANLRALQRQEQQIQEAAQRRSIQDQRQADDQLLKIIQIDPSIDPTKVATEQNTPSGIQRAGEIRKALQRKQKEAQGAERIQPIAEALSSPTPAQENVTPAVRSLQTLTPEQQQDVGLRISQLRSLREEEARVAASKPPGSEFERTLRRLNLPPEIERQVLATRLQRLIGPTGGLSITTPDGTTITTGPETLRSTDQKIVDRFVTASNAAEDMRELMVLIESDIRNAGIVGTARVAGSEVVSMLDDIQSAATGTKIAEFAAKTLAAMEVDPKLDPSVLEGGKAFLAGSETAGKVDSLLYFLSYAVVRSQEPSGRLTDKDIDRAAKAIGVRGLNSSERVLARLRTTQARIERAAKVSKKMLESNPRLNVLGASLLEPSKSTGAPSQPADIPHFRINPETQKLERID